MKIFFCTPEENAPSKKDQEAWERGERVPFEDIHGKATHQSWIYQTYLFLKQNGIECHFSRDLEVEGIVIIIGGALDNHRRPPKEVFLVDVVADGTPHPGAHFHILQNRAHAALLPSSLYMPHWPQPHLIRRDPARGSLFKNIAFFGNPYNLARELRSEGWINLLREQMGLSFHLYTPDSWHDYSNVDAVIAVRDFSNNTHLNKPAAKLYNAWLAGVPFIGGRDSAYQADGEPWKNYLMATSLQEVATHLQRLQVYPELRHKLVLEGLKAGSQFTQRATLDRWLHFFKVLLPKLVELKDACYSQ